MDKLTNPSERPLPLENKLDPKCNTATYGLKDVNSGNLWEYTSEFQDDHSRYAVLFGPGRFQPNCSPYCSSSNRGNWYFPFTEAYAWNVVSDDPTWTNPTSGQNTNDPMSLMSMNKYFLMDSTYERAETLGFRC